MAEYVCELPVEGMLSFVSGTTTIPAHERIVRCRDCASTVEHYKGMDIHWCGFLAMYVGPNCFCCWGERREDA